MGGFRWQSAEVEGYRGGHVDWRGGLKVVVSAKAWVHILPAIQASLVFVLR